ncbi:MAG: TIGR03943 family protein [Candidatus Omnitrophica bacterium]|nr:TIGR03943 family protein [Candidatus Omnitrophota bacterium]
MKKHSFDWNGFYRNLVVSLWIACLLFLIISGNINLFIKRSYLFLPVLGTLIMGLILIARLTKKKGERKENPWIFIILVIPLVFAVGVRPGNLGEFAASRKGLVTSGVAMNEKSRDKLIRNLEEARSYQHVNLKEILSLKEKNVLNGLKLKTEGLVMEKKNDVAKHYYLVRFLMNCCAADALPLAVEIKNSDDFATSAGHWVEIWGILHSGPEGFFIEPEKILPIPEPQDPYLF